MYAEFSSLKIDFVLWKVPRKNLIPAEIYTGWRTI
jgi:hypothetical protein